MGAIGGMLTEKASPFLSNAIKFPLKYNNPAYHLGPALPPGGFEYPYSG